MSGYRRLSNVIISSSGHYPSMESGSCSVPFLPPILMTSLDCNITTDDGTFTSYYCRSSRQIFVESNYSSLLLNDWASVEPLQVMIGYTSDTSDIVTRTETPVMLMPGMNLVGFAYQHRVRRFRSPTLATLGLFQVRTSIIDFIMNTRTPSFNCLDF